MIQIAVAPNNGRTQFSPTVRIFAGKPPFLSFSFINCFVAIYSLGGVPVSTGILNHGKRVDVGTS